jgi:hypothetical protein
MTRLLLPRPGLGACAGSRPPWRPLMPFCRHVRDDQAEAASAGLGDLLQAQRRRPDGVPAHVTLRATSARAAVILGGYVRPGLGPICLGGTFEVSLGSARYRLTCRSAAATMAGRGLLSPRIWGRWLPVRLPETSLATCSQGFLAGHRPGQRLPAEGAASPQGARVRRGHRGGAGLEGPGAAGRRRSCPPTRHPPGLGRSPVGRLACGGCRSAGTGSCMRSPKRGGDPAHRPRHRLEPTPG